MEVTNETMIQLRVWGIQITVEGCFKHRPAQVVHSPLELRQEDDEFQIRSLPPRTPRLICG